MAATSKKFIKWLMTCILVFCCLFPLSKLSRLSDDPKIDDVLRTYRRYNLSMLFQGREYWMGVNDPQSVTGEYPELQVFVPSFYIDQYPVTNVLYWEFLRKKRMYVPDSMKSGWSWVFEKFVSNQTRERLSAPGTGFWLAVKRANWEHPEGPDTDINKRWTHPVTHVSWRDAQIYCGYYGKRLPTEQEWELAARGTKLVNEHVQYPWGDLWVKNRMNTWQGKFPFVNKKSDGYEGTSPVDAYPRQNTDGMYDMLGNVWEWTSSRYEQLGVHPKHQENLLVLKGGSHLDSVRGDFGYTVRISNRMPQAPDYTASNVGFRCAKSAPDVEPIGGHRPLPQEWVEKNRKFGRVEL